MDIFKKHIKEREHEICSKQKASPVERLSKKIKHTIVKFDNERMRNVCQNVPFHFSSEPIADFQGGLFQYLKFTCIFLSQKILPS